MTTLDSGREKKKILRQASNVASHHMFFLSLTLKMTCEILILSDKDISFY